MGSGLNREVEHLSAQDLGRDELAWREDFVGGSQDVSSALPVRVVCIDGD